MRLPGAAAGDFTVVVAVFMGGSAEEVSGAVGLAASAAAGLAASAAVDLVVSADSVGASDVSAVVDLDVRFGFYGGYGGYGCYYPYYYCYY